MNLCADQYAMLLAAPGQLVSVSHVARDPLSSPLAHLAEGYPVNRGGAEEIFALRPDLVLANEWSDPATLAILRRLGIRVETFPIADRLDGIPAQLRAFGAVLGRAGAGEVAAGAFEARLAGLAAQVPEGARPVAAIYQPNGYTPGEGGMSAQILEVAGFRNLASELGLTYGGFMPLEWLITSDPDLIVRGARYAGASRSEEMLDHPALRALRGAQASAQSDGDWGCGTPLVLDAVERMIDLRKRMEAGG